MRRVFTFWHLVDLPYYFLERVSPQLQQIWHRVKERRARWEIAQGRVARLSNVKRSGKEGLLARREAINSEAEALRDYAQAVRDYGECLLRETRPKEKRA